MQAILFSHPGDFTPVCTTELGEVARRADDFAKRNVKLIGISANGLQDHNKWVEDINEFGSRYGPTNVQFPIVSILVYLSVGLQRLCRLPMKTDASPPSMTCLMSKMPLTAMPRVFPLRYV